jgi:hypothetical protein
MIILGVAVGLKEIAMMKAVSEEEGRRSAVMLHHLHSLQAFKISMFQ